MASKTSFCRHAMYFGMEVAYPTADRNWRPTLISRSGSGYGSGSRRTVFTTVNTAVLAPMPSASASVASAVKVQFRRIRRRA